MNCNLLSCTLTNGKMERWKSNSIRKIVAKRHPIFRNSAYALLVTLLDELIRLLSGSIRYSFANILLLPFLDFSERLEYSLITYSPITLRFHLHDNSTLRWLLETERSWQEHLLIFIKTEWKSLISYCNFNAPWDRIHWKFLVFLIICSSHQKVL